MQLQKIYKQHFVLPNIKVEKISQNESSFKISPLNPGLAATLCACVSRFSFSSLPTIRPSSFSFPSLENFVEYGSSNGIKEDHHQISYNIRAVVLKKEEVLNLKEEENTYEAEISVKGPCVVKASDIIFKDKGISIQNPNQVICSITSDLDFKMKLTAMFGVGMKLVSEDLKYSENGTINLDINFNPVLNIISKIDEVRVGDKIDYESLEIVIKTNGSITPEEAFDISLSMFYNLFKRLCQFKDLFDFCIKKEEVSDKSSSLEDSKKKIDNLKKILRLPCDQLGLSSRAINALISLDAERVGDYYNLSKNALISTPHFGTKSNTEVESTMAEITGINPGQEIPKEAMDDFNAFKASQAEGS